MKTIVFKPQHITLKNGKTVKLRLCDESDAENLIKTVSAYIENSDCIPLCPHEFKPTIEEEMNWITKFIQEQNSILIVAIYKGEIIGNIDLSGNQREIMQHTGIIGMGILKDWRNTGLGTALLKALIDWATTHPILEKLVLGVYHNNKPGIALYTKMGFKKAGIHHKMFKHNNTYYDEILMHLEL